MTISRFPLRRSCLVIVLSLLPIQAMADTDMNAKMTAIADRVWQNALEKQPDLRPKAGLPVTEIPDLSYEQHIKDVAFAKSILESLKSIDVSKLSEDSHLTYDAILEDNTIAVGNEPYYWLDFSIVPYKIFRSLAFIHDTLRNHAMASDSDRQTYFTLLQEYRDLFVQHLDKIKGQADRDLLLSKEGRDSVVAMLEGTKANLHHNVMVGQTILETLPATERKAIEAKAKTYIDQEIAAVLTDLIAFLGDDYRKRAPQGVGLAYYPGGKEYYRHLVQAHTALTMSPEDIHALGLKRVAEITAAIKEKSREVGFDGTVLDFFKDIKKKPRFIDKTPADLEKRFHTYLQRIEPKISHYFAHLPKAPYDVKRLPEADEKGLTFGYYKPPTALDPCGYYVYNASHLEDKSQVTAGFLIYHELIPGHHLQIARQEESTTLHPYRKNYWSTAFIEGWAEYGSSLGYEMGMYDDPYDDIGRKIGELFLATRLVVDTGLGYYGWSLEQARQFMRDHMFQSEAEILSDSLRYSTYAGQALAYRLGLEKIWELRRKSEAALGDDFDIREFHEIVLDGGSIPLSALERRVERYIAAHAPKSQ